VEPQLRILSARPVEPSAAEVAGNPRARSARMRYAEKLSCAELDDDA
jgi:16S rRNA (cytosine1402-N4)-methyltransferase